MEIFNNFAISKKYKKSSLAVGNFDGVHKGHQKVFLKTRKYARRNNIKFGVLTFTPLPVMFFNRKIKNFRLASENQKVDLLKKNKVDFVINIKFNKKFSSISAENFIKIVLCKGLSVQHIVIGDDFRFGHNREGDINYLKSQENKNNFKVHIINEISGENVRYSSSIVRDMILKGKMLDTNKVLGYFYEIEGRVVKGEKLGRELGFPTANVHYLNTIIPHDGVYAGWVQFNNKTYKSAISTGCRPQFKGKKRFLEAHIIDFSGDIYGTRIKVSLVKKIRNEEVFSNIENLKKQMGLDCNEAIKILEENKI